MSTEGTITSNGSQIAISSSIISSDQDDAENQHPLPPSVTEVFRKPSFPRVLIDASRLSYYNGPPNDIANKRLDGRLFPLGGGCLAGSLLSYLTTSTGLETAMHEIAGHGLLGLHLTHNYAEGEGPRYQVNGWDNLKAIGNADSFLEGLKEFYRLLTGYDRYGGGAAGRTWFGQGEPNALGRAMGEKGLSAWISISGSLPGMMTNTLMVTGGMKLKNHEPTTGYMLVAFGISQHLMSSYYPWSAAVMSENALIKNAQLGHDFANFSIQIGDITGVPPQAVAISTAVLWTAFVPAVAIAMYFYQKAHETDIVPDHVALQNWLSKAPENKEIEKQLEKYLENYPRKEKLITLWHDFTSNLETGGSCVSSKKLRIETRRFTEHLLDKLPKKTLNKSKKEVLRKWEKLQAPDIAQKTLSILSIIGTITTIATKFLYILGQTIAPYLATVATVFTYASPLFTGISVISSGYETYKDLKSPDASIPKVAKMLSVAKLVVAVVSAIGITAGMFVPGLNGVLIAAVIVGVIGAIALAYARHRIIKHRFKLLQSLQPGNWGLMYDLLEVYRADHGNINVSRKDSKYRGLHKWLSHQKDAQKCQLLAEEQINRLIKIGLFPLDSKDRTDSPPSFE